MSYIKQLKIEDADDNTKVVNVIQNEDDNTDLDNTHGIVTASALYARVNGKILPLEIDPTTNNLEITDHRVAAIHAEEHYYIEGYAALDSGDTLYIKLDTPDTTKWAHFNWQIQSTGELLTTLDEDASGGMTGGSAMTPINSNRNSSNTSAIVITSGVTNATSYVTRVSSQKFGSTGSKFGSNLGGVDNPEAELILKQNTTYLRSYTSGTDGNVVSFRADWHEHTNNNQF